MARQRNRIIPSASYYYDSRPHGIVYFDGQPNGPTQIGSLEQRLLGTYPGSLGNFAGVQLGLPVDTIEFKTAGSMPKTEEIEQMWKDVVE